MKNPWNLTLRYILAISAILAMVMAIFRVARAIPRTLGDTSAWLGVTVHGQEQQYMTNEAGQRCNHDFVSYRFVEKNTVLQGQKYIHAMDMICQKGHAVFF